MKWIIRVFLALAAILVVAFLVFRVPDTDPDDMRAKYGGPPSRFVELENGLTVHLRDEGPREALPVVLLHGSNADLHTWQPWADALAGEYRIVRFDQRGHGLTGPAPDNDYSRAAFGSDIEAIADQLGLTRFVVAGNSMGGGIAMQYALDHPERVVGLVLVDAAGAPVEQEVKGNIAFTIAANPLLGPILSSLLPRSLVERSLSQSVSNQDVVTPEAVDRYWELARIPGNRAATRQRFTTPRSYFSAEQVAKASMPVLVMWGEEDALIPFQAAGWYDRNLPDSRLVSYAGIGHLPHEEAPAQSVKDLREFLVTLPLNTQ